MKFTSMLGWVSLAIASSVAADVKLPSIISNHMVLQRDVPLPIWGWADAGEDITVKIADQTKTTRANDAGKWSVKLDPIAAGENLTLTVAGKNTLTVEDILVGEVWLCSGQSNMQWAVRQSKDSEKVQAEANYPKLRLYHVKRKASETKLEDAEGAWRVCSPTTLAEFSAVAYHFGREVHLATQQPVGLVHSSWGGTPAEAWTDVPYMEKNEMLKPILENDAKLPPATQPKDERPHNRPGRLYNAMIDPVKPFAIKGAIWYQGETNAPRAFQYRTLLPTMIQNWRDAWGQGDFPFLIVQLANYQKEWTDPNAGDGWAELREAQTLTAKNLPQCGRIVIIDVGEQKDIHPKDKQTVGHRLALLAQKQVYGLDVIADSPTYKSMKVENGKAILTFDHVGTGLKAGEELGSFAIAGADKKFVWAKAKVTGKDTVEVWAEGITEPIAVRYAWGMCPMATLFSNDGLPADPFRTDDFPGVTDSAR